MSLGEAIILALRWYLAATALAVLAYPVVFHAARALPDRGLSLARPLGLLLMVLGPWWLSAAGLVPFTNTVVVAVMLIGAAGVWSLELRRRALVPFLRANWRTAVAVEGATLVLFVGYVAFRGFNPDIAYTEKPMDLAFLTSAMHATHLPPPDPWFAGQPINYYYLGYLTMAVVGRLSGVVPTVTFNLALATLFAYASTVAAGTAANAVRLAAPGRRWRAVAAGVLGALFLVGVGNLYTPLEFITHARATLSAGWWEGVGWNASRIIVDHGIPGSSTPHQTINEFPAFSFVLGDLHPHLLAYPVFLAVAGLALGILAYTRNDGSRVGRFLPVVLAGTVSGALYAMNSWDAPTALALAGGALLLRARPCARRAAAADLATLAASAAMVAAPFAVRYTPSVGVAADAIPRALLDLPVVGFVVRTIGVVVWSRSAAGSLLTVHGLFLAVALVLIGALWLVAARPRPPLAWVGGAAALAAVAAVAGQFPALFLFGLPLAALVWSLRRAKLTPSLAYASGMFSLAFILILVAEVFFLQDAFGDRMNTVFKVYFQVWGLLAIASAAALPLVLPVLGRTLGRAMPLVAGTVIGLLVLGCALYPPLSAYHWASGFDRWQGLDGLAYLDRAHLAEGRAIDWLAAHRRPSDVVLEAPGCSYGVAGGIPDDRVSMATGIPTVIGWDFHEYQWRNGQPALRDAITTRQQEVNTIYEHPTSPAARDLLDRLGVTYIYVGTLERSGQGAGCTAGPPYPAASLDQIARLGWQPVFTDGPVVIYQRPAK